MSINVLSWSYWIYEYDIIRDVGKTSSGAIDPRFIKPWPYPLLLPFLSLISLPYESLFLLELVESLGWYNMKPC